MNNTLTAKEWLEKEGIYRSVAQGIDIGIIVERGIINSELMERYANYKTKMLEAKILGFRNELKSPYCRELYFKDILFNEFLNSYDKYFGIVVQTEGKIG